MALQNRVTPFGEIVPISARGTLMGNRGCLHNDRRQLVRTQASRKDWVTCRLQFKDRRRPLMAPGKYTELFFLDEATALAAGHRPCNECRPERLALFKQSWAIGVLQLPGARLLVGQIDAVLHQDRVVSKRAQRRFAARTGELPDGTMVQLSGEVGIARLKWESSESFVVTLATPTGGATLAASSATVTINDDDSPPPSNGGGGGGGGGGVGGGFIFGLAVLGLSRRRKAH